MSTSLSPFDRVGVGIIALLGICLGFLIAVASDIGVTPLLAVLYPGVLVGLAFAKLGLRGAVLACAVSNGMVYGVVWFAWLRVANGLISGLPKWSTKVAHSITARHRE